MQSVSRQLSGINPHTLNYSRIHSGEEICCLPIAAVMKLRFDTAKVAYLGDEIEMTPSTRNHFETMDIGLALAGQVETVRKSLLHRYQEANTEAIIRYTASNSHTMNTQPDLFCGWRSCTSLALLRIWPGVELMAFNQLKAIDYFQWPFPTVANFINGKWTKYFPFHLKRVKQPSSKHLAHILAAHEGLFLIICDKGTHCVSFNSSTKELLELNYGSVLIYSSSDWPNKSKIYLLYKVIKD